MSNLVSAEDYANFILKKVINTISAIRIQKTWRVWSWRSLSKINMINNYVYPSWGKGQAKRGDIKDLLEGMEVKKKSTKITFSEMYDAKMIDNSTCKEYMDTEDGNNKGTTKFTQFVHAWSSFDKSKEKSYFFNGYVKAWVDCPSSEHWEPYFERILKLLDDGVCVRLWGHTGATKHIRPFEKDEVRSLRDYWKLHKINEEISKLRSEYLCLT